MPKQTKTLKQQIQEQKDKIFELEQEYCVQLYLETMPDEFDYKYGYKFDQSNMSIPYEYHHPEYWLRAIVKHMWTRKASRGGAKTLAEVVSVPSGYTEKQIDRWLAYVTDKLKKKALAHKKRANKTTKPK